MGACRKVTSLALLIGVAVGSVACAAAETSNDEVYDFRETTTSEVRGGTPYDTYVLLAEQAGIDFLDLRAAETRAQELCADPGGVNASSEERSVQDAALVAAFCPGGASGTEGIDSGDGG